VPPPLAGPRGSPPPINITPHLSIEASNYTASISSDRRNV
jgi:hypothetical protein